MKISVLVPVYNVEKYLNRCVDSILNQTYRDFELLLVDDGSTDSSGRICDEYESAYPFVHVFHNKNSGLSHARNYGTERAKGIYVTYIDSDDYVAPDYLQCLYETAVNYHAEVSCARFEIVDDSSVIKPQSSSGNTVKTYTGIEACEALLYGRGFCTSACNCLIRTDIARKNLFPVGKYHEDELTTFRYLLSASTVAATDRVLYYYYQRESSIMHTFGQAVIDEVSAADNYVAYFKPMSKAMYRAAMCKKYSLYAAVIRDYPQIETACPDLYTQVVRFLRTYSVPMLLNRKTTFGCKKMVMGVLLKKIF